MAKVRDRRHFGFFMIDNAIIDNELWWLGTSGFLVYAALVRYAGSDGKTCPKYDTLTKVLGISRRTIARAIRSLEDNRLIEIVRVPGKPSTYQLVDRLPYHAPESGNGRYVQLPQSVQKITSVNPCHHETAAGSDLASPRFPGGTTSDLRHVAMTKTQLQTPAVEGDGSSANGPENAPQHSLLASCGVFGAKAERLAESCSLDLLECAVAYWRGGCGGTKPVGPGLLVRVCEKPADFGIVQTLNGWKHPPLLAQRGRAAAPPAKPARSAEERAAQVLRDRAADQQSRKAAESGRTLLFRESNRVKSPQT